MFIWSPAMLERQHQRVVRNVMPLLLIGLSGIVKDKWNKIASSTYTEKRALVFRILWQQQVQQLHLQMKLYYIGCQSRPTYERDIPDCSIRLHSPCDFFFFIIIIIII